MYLYRAAMTERGQIREPSPYEALLRGTVEEARPLLVHSRTTIGVQGGKMLDRRSILLGR
jgi:hypothetical protein